MTLPRPILQVAWAFHRALALVSGGRLGTHRATGDGLGTLYLHTTGRKSGHVRTNPLFYVTDGDDLVIVASNAGATFDPAWAMNLRAEPTGEVEIEGRRRVVRGREATPDEVARLWPKLIAANPDYEAYRATADRTIPVFILEPV